MDFPKVAACCADTVVIVRITACRFPVSNPVYYDFRSTF